MAPSWGEKGRLELGSVKSRVICTVLEGSHRSGWKSKKRAVMLSGGEEWWQKNKLGYVRGIESSTNNTGKNHATKQAILACGYAKRALEQGAETLRITKKGTLSLLISCSGTLDDGIREGTAGKESASLDESG